MTLIACTINHKVPFMTADILMSSESGQADLILPTAEYAINPFINEENSYRPDSFAQKLYVFGKNLCVAVAGAEFELKQFLHELRTRCNIYDRITTQQLKAFLDEYDLQQHLPRSAFFILCIEHTGPDSLYVGMVNFPKKMNNYDVEREAGWMVLENDVYDQIFACGSGAQQFLNIVNQTGTFETRHLKGSIWYAMQSNISLITKILAIERTTLYNLNSNWGAGLETAFYNGQEFEKVSNMVYAICHGQFSEQGDIGYPTPQLLLYYTYHEGRLIIVKIKVGHFKEESLGENVRLYAGPESFQVVCYDVESLLDDYTEAPTLQDYSFTTMTVAMGYAIITPENGVFVPTSYNVHGILTVKYRHNKYLEMTLNKGIYESVRQACKNVFDKIWLK
jgi:hypothetical protein